MIGRPSNSSKLARRPVVGCLGTVNLLLITADATQNQLISRFCPIWSPLLSRIIKLRFCSKQCSCFLDSHHFVDAGYLNYVGRVDMVTLTVHQDYISSKLSITLGNTTMIYPGLFNVLIWSSHKYTIHYPSLPFMVYIILLVNRRHSSLSPAIAIVA